MKRLDLSNIIAGTRRLGLLKATLQHMEEALMEAHAAIIEGILATAAGYTVLRGCVNSGSGATYNISAGSIYLAGEVYDVNAFAGTAGGGQVPVMSLVTTFRAEDPVIYSDGSTFNTHQIRKMQWAFGASGSALVDFSALQTLKQRLNSNLLDVPGQISTAVAALVNSSPSTLDTLKELADALGDDPNFATTITGLIGGKVSKSGDAMTGNLAMGGNKVTGAAAASANGELVRYEQLIVKAEKALPAWTNFTLLNGWADLSAGVTPPGYRITDQGEIQLRGIIDPSAASSSTFGQAPGLMSGGLSVYLLIANMNPSTPTNHSLIAQDLTGTANFLITPFTASSKSFDLSAIRFYPNQGH